MRVERRERERVIGLGGIKRALGGGGVVREGEMGIERVG